VEQPFPLFAAPLPEASGYTGPGPCVVCGAEADERLRLVGGARVVSQGRPSDAQSTADDAVCVPCLRAGHVAFTRDTEFGMVRFEDAVAGHTHGMPGLKSADGFPLSPADEDGWVRVEIPALVLLELVRTPGYETWQGENWLFCCGSAMVYIGQWTRDDVFRHVPGDPAAAFVAIFDGAEPWMWDTLENLHIGFHAFRCRSCDRVRGHMDMS
jgi:uncharacterized protein CbrC (UPF0167 family)